jgi:outer membrane protein assembly factor BamB/tetratricopeptide (TPR) repeat protein
LSGQGAKPQENESRRAMGGRLTTASYASLLRRVESSRTAGYVLVSDGRSEKCFFFPVGAVRASSVGTRHVRDLESMLRAHPEVDDATVDQLLRLRDGERSPGVDHAFVDASTNKIVYACSHAIVRDELIDVVVWDGAHFEYREGNPPPKIFDPRLKAVKLSTGVTLLLQEVQQKVARWKELAPRFGTLRKLRISRGNDLQLALLDSAALGQVHVTKELCEALCEAAGDKGCGFDEAVFAARGVGSDAVEAAEALIELADAQLLHLGVSASSSTGVRDDPTARAAAEREVEDIENALELMIDSLVARMRLAECYQVLGNQNEALKNFRIAGEQLSSRGRLDEALGVFRKVLSLKPRDFSARERVVNLLQRMRRMPEAIQEGLELAGQYQSFRLFNRAANVFRRLIGWSPKDVDLRRRLIDMLVRTDQKRQAVAEFERLALLYEELEDEEAALACYQQLLSLDPKNRTAKAQLDQFARRSKAFVMPYVGIAAGYLLLALSALYVFDRYQDVKAFRQARAESYRLAELSDFTGARRVLSEVAVKHDVPVGKLRLLREEVDRLESYHREDRAYVLLREARKHEEALESVAARELYGQVVNGFARTRAVAEAEARIRSLDRDEDEARRMEHQVRLLRRDGKGAEEFELVRALVRRFPGTQVAAAIELPLEIRSQPSGALLRVDGQSVNARTPFQLRRAARSPLELQLSLDGFEPWKKVVDAANDDLLAYPLEVALQRRSRWRSVTVGPLVASPWVDRDLVVVGGSDQRVRAFDARGAQVWSRPVGFGAAVVVRPVRAGRVVMVATSRGEVLGLDATTGDQLWRRKTRGAVGGLSLIDARSVVVVDEGGVARIDEQGETLWRIDPGARAITEPVVVSEHNAICVTLADAALCLIDAETGRVAHRIDTGARVTVQPGRVFGGVVVANEEGRCMQVDARDGGVVWARELDGRPTGGVVCSERMAFVALGARVVALRLDDGTERWSRELNAPVDAAPAYAAGKVFVGTAAGELLALSASTGDVRWGYQTGGRIAAAPVVQDDTVYAVSTDYVVHAVVD